MATLSTTSDVSSGADAAGEGSFSSTFNWNYFLLDNITGSRLVDHIGRFTSLP